MSLKVKTNRLICGDSDFVFRGVSIPDIVYLEGVEHQDIFLVIDWIKDLGFNCVRVPILPGHFIYYPNYLKNKILPVVDYLEKKGLYCILDWHAIGNPLYNQTRLQEYFHKNKDKIIYWYLADLDVAKKGLKDLVQLFGKRNHILFEVFNEPAPGEKEIPRLGLSPLPWKKWKKSLNEIIRIIRENSNNIIIVSSPYWTHHINLSAKDPIDDENIAYSFHTYPTKNNEKWKELLNKANKLPIIITEWGFDTDKKLSQYYVSNDKYGKSILNYCKKNNISWIAWCFSSKWRPKMVKEWNLKKLTFFGKLVISYLKIKL